MEQHIALLPDRIETGTYMCAVGLCGGELHLEKYTA